MAAPKRTQVQIEQDRAHIARLYLQGWTQAAIGAHLDMTQQMVSYDLLRVQEAWRESALVDINEAKARELARIDELERTYWIEWEASREDWTATMTKAVDVSGTTRKEATKRTEQRLGDPRYLSGVQWCIERRCAIMGIDAPKKAEIGGAVNLTARLTSDDLAQARAQAQQFEDDLLDDDDDSISQSE